MTGLMSVVFTEFVDQKSQLTCWPFYSFIYDKISLVAKYHDYLKAVKFFSRNVDLALTKSLLTLSRISLCLRQLACLL